MLLILYVSVMKEWLLCHSLRCVRVCSIYSIGFVRYESDPLKNYSHTTFEHDWIFQNFNEVHLVHDAEGMKNTTYFSPGGLHHHGMYMATSEQLQAWSERLNCRSNDTTTVYPKHYDQDIIREYVSSCWLPKVITISSSIIYLTMAICIRNIY